MAKSKILFCRFKHPIVEPLAEWNSKYAKQADHVIRTLNDTVVQSNGEFDDEFWFLEKRIKGKTKIITLATAHHYPENDPAIITKLAAYLEAKNDNFKGTSQNRGSHNRY